VWIPPGELRDQRDLPRTRMVLSRQRIGLKNRIHATLAKYAIRVEEVSDIFGTRGLKLLEAKLPLLPPHNRYATEELLAQLEQVVAGIGRFEQRMREVFAPSEKLQLIETLPGVGFILAVVILVEVGDVERLARAEQLAAYAGTTPRGIASGGCEPLPEVGVRGGGQQHLPAPTIPAILSCQPAVRTGTGAQRPSESDWGGGPPPGGSHLLDTTEIREVPGSE
jgi:transposase